MQRREFVTLAGGAAAAWPLAARAQQRALPVIGFLSSSSPTESASRLAAFRQGLNDTGYVEHRNVGIEYRWAEGQYDHLPAMAADLVRLQVSVIAAATVAAALATRVATTTIPMVFNTGGDPVKLGLVSSLNRPGGNVTGFSFLSTELIQKRLELMHRLVPAATVIGLLVNPTGPTSQLETSDLQAAARLLGLHLHIENASSDQEIDAAFARFDQQRVNALFLITDAFFTERLEQLVALAARHSLPASYGLREFVAVGGLMS